jgi:hypothetical protein
MTADDKMAYVHALARFMHETMRAEPLPSP